MKTPQVVFRQARPGDMVDCARVSIRSSTDLSRRQGVNPPPLRVRDMAPSLAHLQSTDPKGFQVAVKDGRIIAFASTILRGNTHFLSMFWALPSLQSKGIGRRLLTRAFEHPRPPATAVRCVFASLDLRAQTLYLKFGMRPRGMFYMIKGKPKPAARPRLAVDLEPIGRPGTTSPEMLAIAGRFDRIFRGTRRDPDIRFVTTLPDARFFRARVGRNTMGYAVINPRGRVGPAGVIDPRYSAGLAWAIQNTAREMGAETIMLNVPGMNTSALEVFFRSGFKTVFFGAWMAARPVGSFESYVLAGGMLL